MKSSSFFETQRTAIIYGHLKVCVWEREDKMQVAVDLSILKATLATSYKNIWPNKGTKTIESRRCDRRREETGSCESHSPCAVFVRVILACGSRCLWELWAPLWESCSGFPAQPHDSPNIWHILSSFCDTRAPPPYNMQIKGQTRTRASIQEYKHMRKQIIETQVCGYLFFIRRTSLLRVASSAFGCGLCIAPGDAAITTPGGSPDDGERIWYAGMSPVAATCTNTTKCII